jgi:hypothetical protein
MKKVTTLGIDLAKNVFQLHGVNEHGKAVLRRQVRRAQLLFAVAQLEPCLIGMEAGAGAHHWSRQFAAFEHTVRLMSPQFVKPYVKSQKMEFPGFCGHPFSTPLRGGFKLLRTYASQIPVAARAIVERLDVFADVRPRQLSVLVDSFLNALLFQAAEE